MTDLAEIRVDQGIVPCIDEDCIDEDGRPSLAEIERDGEHIYFECQECGATFGYQKAGETSDETCAVGVPESVRRRMSQGMENALEAERRAAPVPIELGRRPS